nr:hypothetical protein [Yersinia pekkanenii]
MSDLRQTTSKGKYELTGQRAAGVLFRMGGYRFTVRLGVQVRTAHGEKEKFKASWGMI